MAQPKHQARRLNPPALVALLRRDAGRSGNQSVGSCVDRHPSAIFADAAGRGEARAGYFPRARSEAIRQDRLEEISVQEQMHAGLAHHFEQQRLVRLRIERRDRGNVVGRIVDVTGRSARAHQALHDLLRDAADDAIRTGMKSHPRTDHRGGGRSAEEPVALDQHRARAVARRRDRGGATRVSAADHEHVELTHGLAASAGIGEGHSRASAKSGAWQSRSR